MIFLRKGARGREQGARKNVDDVPPCPLPLAPLFLIYPKHTILYFI